MPLSGLLFLTITLAAAAMVILKRL
jgi:hypothetical protein